MGENSATRISKLVFREIAYSPGGRGNRKRVVSPHFHLIKLFMLDSQLALHEALYLTPRARDHSEGEEGEEEEEGQKERHVLGVGKIFRQFGGRNENLRHSSFVVDDWDESVRSMPSQPRIRRPSYHPPAEWDLLWTLDFNRIYQEASGYQDMSVGFTDLLQMLQAGLPDGVLASQFKRLTMCVIPRERPPPLKKKVYDRN